MRAGRVLAVSSCKGGVGKSTVAVNLAAALAGRCRVGLLDTDLYGPSIPTMLNLKGQQPLAEDKKFIPLSNYGIQAMSMGFLVPEGKATVLRGPMVTKLVKQLYHDTKWDTDLLILDLPPGTGDIQLTLAQELPLTASLVVSTAQEVALDDVLRGINMFRTVKVPVLGLVENMSYFKCTSCSAEHRLFGSGLDKKAKELDLEILARLPFVPKIQELSDAGSLPSLSI